MAMTKKAKVLGPKAMAALISEHPAFRARGGLRASFRTAKEESVLLRFDGTPHRLVYLTAAGARHYLASLDGES